MPRRWFQIRLSTWIAVVLALGLLLGLDLTHHGWPMECWPIDEATAVRRCCVDVMVHITFVVAVGSAVQIWMGAAEES